MSEIGPLPADVLPPDIRSRFVDGVNGQRVHVLEVGADDAGAPGVLLLHGFPELAFSWRHLIPPLAAAGYRVIAPDLRGYGRTTPDPVDYDDDLAPYRRLNVVRDILGLVAVLGFRSIRVVGHDFGSPIAAWCAVIRPDVFTSVALMSAPFAGTPDMRDGFGAADRSDSLYEDLARLARPRKHYQRYYQTREANANMWRAPQGVHDLLRGYFHYKSADWEGNRPFQLAERTASQMAKMPTYYVMERDDGMAQTVAKNMPSAAEVAGNRWLPDDELSVYAGEYGRTGFQGGLNHYRSGAVGMAEQQLFAGRRIEQPSVYIAGASDWGSYQSPGALERMAGEACADLRGVHLVDGAGHWVQQEQAQETAMLLLGFFAGQKDGP